MKWINEVFEYSETYLISFGYFLEKNRANRMIPELSQNIFGSRPSDFFEKIKVKTKLIYHSQYMRKPNYNKLFYSSAWPCLFQVS